MSDPNQPIAGRMIPMASADKAQLKAFCIARNVPVQNFDTPERLKQKLYGSGWHESYIVDYDEPVADEGAPVGVQPGHDRYGIRIVKEPIVEIHIFEQEGHQGKSTVPVLVNGTCILLPRLKPIKIKHRYWAALNNARGTKLEYDPNTDDYSTKEVPSYPFQVISMPPDSELQAWSDYNAAVQRAEVAEAAGNKSAAA